MSSILEDKGGVRMEFLSPIKVAKKARVGLYIISKVIAFR
jgi:hypothetical protein